MLFNIFISCRCSEKTINLLNESKYNKIESGGILPTKLCTHKDDVEFINKIQIDAIKSKLTHI